MTTVERLERFVASRERMTGTDPEVVTVSNDAPLLMSDLRAAISAMTPPPPAVLARLERRLRERIAENAGALKGSWNHWRAETFQQVLDEIEAASLAQQVGAVTGRIGGYLLRAQAIEFITDGPLPEWVTHPNLPAVIATRATFEAIGREGQGHSAEWCAGWNAHMLATLPAAVAVDEAAAMFNRGWDAAHEYIGQTSYHAGPFYAAALNAALQPAATSEGENNV